MNDPDTEVVIDTEVETDTKVTGNTRSRSLFITINNYTKEEENRFKEIDCVYSIYQIEEGEACHTPHLHGFIYFKNARTWKSIKKLFPRARIEVPKNINHVIKYCGKEKTRIRGPYEKGTKPSQGTRTDLEDLRDQIMKGEITVKDIILDMPGVYHQYGRTLNEIQTCFYNKNIRTEMTQGFWLWGETGVGKSHTARKIAEDATIYDHPTNDKTWWDGYKQEEVVIIDDFRGEIAYNEILKLVDCWPHKVSRRNIGPINFTSSCVIITSSLPPEDIFRKRNAEDSIEQLLRRFEVINIRKQSC